MLIRAFIVSALLALTGCAAQFPEPTGSRNHEAADAVLEGRRHRSGDRP